MFVAQLNGFGIYSGSKMYTDDFRCRRRNRKLAIDANLAIFCERL